MRRRLSKYRGRRRGYPVRSRSRRRRRRSFLPNSRVARGGVRL